MGTSKNTVLLAGATGLVGRQCLALLLKAPNIESVVPIVRRPIPEDQPRIHPVVVDFSELDNTAPLTAEVALCAIGTTINKVGSKEAFKSVDYGAVIDFARFAMRSGVKTFGLISSVGASSRSSNFYLRVKGETEDAVGELGFSSYTALRPSLLLGKRTESRPGEAISQKIFPFFSPLLQGATRRLRAIESAVVAKALASLAVCSPTEGHHVWHFDEIEKAAAASEIPLSGQSFPTT